jgi:hypothetical protein
MSIRKATTRAAILALAAALTASGCALKFLPDSISGEQIAKRWVQLDFGVCGVGPDAANCVTGGQEFPANYALIAIRAPEKTGMPYEISEVSGTPITLTRNRAYSRELNELAPRGPHKRWFGYRSTSQAPEEVLDTYFRVKMQVPRDFARDEFGVTPAVGFTGSSAKVECGTDAFGGGPARCITDPSQGNLGSVKIPLTLRG